MEQPFDVVIIGGGINGCGCAADAALRGLRVLLCEQDDLASKTSSSSSNLIHGGLRYLENYDFGLVKKALNERQKLLKIAPHLIRPLPFVLPYQKNLRPFWLLRMGLFIYDHLSRANLLPHSKPIRRSKDFLYFNPLEINLKKGFLFYDAATDDARLTITNARQAKEYGAIIMPHTKLIQAETLDNQWELTLQKKNGSKLKILARSIINAAGPWTKNVSSLLKIPLQYEISLIKGSHLVVPKLYEGNHAYILQHDDKRIVFVTPYHGFSMIGTTDVVFSDDPERILIDPNEIDYLCTLFNRYFNQQLTDKDIISSWSGVRPLLADKNKAASTLSRDYAYHYTDNPAPAVTIYSGKITTYRHLAQKAVDQLRTIFPDLQHSLTETTPLPGAFFESMTFSDVKQQAYKKYSWLDKKILDRYLNSYGARINNLLMNCSKISDLGIDFTQTLYQIEVDYLIKNEWASSSEDLLWRRTKLGLLFDDNAIKKLSVYLKEALASRPLS
jgi:glycerol-3-phosphate dehydrogenase